MSHQIATFDIHAGDDLVIPVHVTEDGEPDGTPVNLTDAAAITFAMAKMDEGRTRVVTKTLGVGIVVVAPLTGDYEITLGNADTFGLLGWHMMQSRVTDSAGDKMTPFTGVGLINESILTATE